MSEINTVGMGDVCDASVVKGSGHNAGLGISGHYEVKCHDSEGNLKWEDVIENRVVNTGLALSLNGALTNTAQGTVVMGLKSAGAVTASDTMINSVAAAGNTAAWTELKLYTVGGSGVRATVSFTALNSTTGQVTSISPTASQVFLANGSMTVAGCFIAVNSTTAFNNTTGTLFSAGDFTGGSKSVVNTDTLSVTYTATGTSS